MRKILHHYPDIELTCYKCINSAYFCIRKIQFLQNLCLQRKSVWWVKLLLFARYKFNYVDTLSI
jgi:hypothetical protein